MLPTKVKVGSAVSTRWPDLRESRRAYFEKLRDADTETDASYLDTARDVLELAKDAKSLLEGRTASEKRDFLARVVL